MDDNTTTRCPITGDLAQVAPATGDFKEFDCPTCGRFKISNTALALAEGQPELLQEALVAAKSRANDQVPTIDNLSG